MNNERDKKVVSYLILGDDGVIDSGLHHDFKTGDQSFCVKNPDGSRYWVTIKMLEVG